MPNEKLQAKIWNERLKLVISFLHITSVGMFGLAVTAPILETLRVSQNGGEGGASALALPEFSISDVIAWEAAAGAWVIQVFAHILVGLMELEE